MKQKKVFRLGDCKIIPTENSIIYDGEEKSSIQPKSIDVLCYLAENYPCVISREELINNVWGENSIVGDNGLTNAIWHLRKIFKSSDGGGVIETIRKVGYKLSISPQWETTYISNDELPVIAKNTSFQLKKLLTPNKKIMSASILIIYFIALFIGYNFQNHEFKPIKNIKITKQQGVETHPKPSPDGHFVAYNKVSEVNGTTDLYIQNVHNLELPPKQITFDAHEEGFSVWSNSGKYLYFSRDNEDTNQCMIVELNVVSLQETELTHCVTGVSHLYLDISPDDKTLAYSHRENNDENLGVYFFRLGQPNSIPVRFSCNDNCGYRDRDMAFSPDGKTIAVSRRTNDYSEDIFLVNLDTKAFEQLTYDEDDILGFTWGSSGKQLIYATQKSDNRYSYVLDLDTKKVENLNIPDFNFPALAKNSNKIFYQVLSEKYHISHLQLGDGVANSPFPTIQSEFNHLNSDYSKQRNRIVYSSNESGYYELWSSDPNGANKKQLTNLRTMVETPRWSNSGEKIAFVSAPDDSISILNVKSHKIVKLPSPFKSHYRPTWSYNDKAIISNISDVDTNDLYQIDILSGKSKQLTFDNGRLGVMISPSTLLYSIPGKGLWQKNIVENTPPINLIKSSLFRTRYTWVYGNNGIYFKQKTKKVYQLNFYDLTEKKLTPLIRIPKYALKSTTALTYIESANRLLFTSSGNPQGSINMLKHPLVK
jgi:Tol biopolymer transport system component/DNA-binding winged helix-turn-helix (wHTH) protein